MAFLWKHPQSKKWQARFIDTAGKRRNRSTGVVALEKNRKEAQKIADSYEEVANRKRTSRQVRQVITELHKEITGEDLPTHTFRDYSDSWLGRKAPEVAPGTLTFYRGAISKFIAFLGEKADAELAEISSDDVLGFRNQEANTLSPTTVNHDLKALRMMFRAARRDKVIVDDPCEFVSATKRGPKVRRRPFTVPD